MSEEGGRKNKRKKYEERKRKRRERKVSLENRIYSSGRKILMKRGEDEMKGKKEMEEEEMEKMSTEIDERRKEGREKR